ncbi:unnamed protein product [Brachionus calyciflorus]|uniref:Tetratricopeptide repeat protein n=1 Tax=Brachionus calyciflorus TaxID=104777 RepID=A0A813TBQ7_9BILA|nr:unnamed protein product [Brachionus calyciflorus]
MQKIMNIDQELTELNIELQKNPNNLQAKKAKAVLLNNKSLVLSKEDKHEEALKLIKQAVQLDPSNVGLLNNQAIFLSKMAKYNEAIESINKSLELEPKNETALEILSVNLNNQFTLDVEKGLNQEALKKINRAIELRPKEIIFHCNKASILNKMSRYTEALGAADKALSLDQNNSNAKHIKSVILNQLALEDSDNEKYEDALKKINEAILLRPNEIGHYINKGSFLINLNRNDEAAKCAEKALELDKDNKDAKKIKEIIQNRK